MAETSGPGVVHNGGVSLQDPVPLSETAAATLQGLGWIDITALVVLGVFFILGLFKGAFWQVSRIAILVAAYVLSVQFGPQLGQVLHRWTHPATEAAAVPPEPVSETALYLSYVIVFLVVLVLLSLLALLVQRLVKSAGLGFFDRVGGGVLGTVTGACVVLFLLGVLHMFFPNSRAAEAATGSHAYRLTREALDTLGERVPDDLRRVFALVPLNASAGEGGTGPEAPTGPRHR